MKRRTAACIIFFLMYMAVLHVSVSTAEKVPATREYFENLDKESRLQDIVEVAGDYSIEGSGILYFVWQLDDGSRAKTVFDSSGRIAMIYIAGENGSERIYKRQYIVNEAGAAVSGIPEADLQEAVSKDAAGCE